MSATTTSLRENGGKSAYPTPRYESGVGTIFPDSGLTKREAFAMAARQGLLSGATRWPDDRDHPELARRSALAADAMLAELAKEPK